jgi:transcription factor C subunit 6
MHALRSYTVTAGARTEATTRRPQAGAKLSKQTASVRGSPVEASLSTFDWNPTPIDIYCALEHQHLDIPVALRVMVSLRERKERVSYSNIPEGLEDLSSSEEGRGSAGGEDGGNGSGDESGASGSGNSSGDEEEGSLSSGDSSEFNPEEEDDDRPKRGRPKGGKNRPRAQESSEDEDMDEEGVSEDEESEVEELKEIEELDEEMGSLRKGSQTSRKSKGRVSILSRQQAGPTVYQKSEINLVPSAYRNLIKLSATTLAKLPAQRPPVPPHDQRYRSLGSLVFPSGGTVPWLTRLASSPDGRKSEIKFVDDKGDKGKRREIEVKVYKRTTLDIPWEAWKGEGWWPEMYDASGASTPGPSRIKGWRMREEVRLGLDEVGRVGMEALDIISEV